MDTSTKLDLKVIDDDFTLYFNAFRDDEEHHQQLVLEKMIAGIFDNDVLLFIRQQFRVNIIFKEEVGNSILANSKWYRMFSQLCYLRIYIYRNRGMYVSVTVTGTSQFFRMVQFHRQRG